MSDAYPESSASHGATILVVEDDPTAADIVALYLRHAGHDVVVEHTGGAALERLRERWFDLLLLDVMLPAPNGLEICRFARSLSAPAVIFLTARNLEEHQLEGFALGGDDYITKPFRPRELVARVEAVLRRTRTQSGRILRTGDLELDRETRTIRLKGSAVDTTPSEFAVLEAMMERPGRVCGRDFLLRRLPGRDGDPLDRTIDVHTRNIRRKLGQDGAGAQYVETVLGAGYRLRLSPASGAQSSTHQIG